MDDTQPQEKKGVSKRYRSIRQKKHRKSKKCHENKGCIHYQSWDINHTSGYYTQMNQQNYQQVKRAVQTLAQCQYSEQDFKWRKNDFLVDEDIARPKVESRQSNLLDKGIKQQITHERKLSVRMNEKLFNHSQNKQQLNSFSFHKRWNSQYPGTNPQEKNIGSEEKTRLKPQNRQKSNLQRTQKCSKLHCNQQKKSTNKSKPQQHQRVLKCRNIVLGTEQSSLYGIDYTNQLSISESFANQRRINSDAPKRCFGLHVQEVFQRNIKDSIQGRKTYDELAVDSTSNINVSLPLQGRQIGRSLVKQIPKIVKPKLHHTSFEKSLRKSLTKINNFLKQQESENRHKQKNLQSLNVTCLKYMPPQSIKKKETSPSKQILMNGQKAQNYTSNSFFVTHPEYLKKMWKTNQNNYYGDSPLRNCLKFNSVNKIKSKIK